MENTEGGRHPPTAPRGRPAASTAPEGRRGRGKVKGRRAGTRRPHLRQAPARRATRRSGSGATCPAPKGRATGRRPLNRQLRMVLITQTGTYVPAPRPRTAHGDAGRLVRRPSLFVTAPGAPACGRGGGISVGRGRSRASDTAHAAQAYAGPARHGACRGSGTTPACGGLPSRLGDLLLPEGHVLLPQVGMIAEGDMPGRRRPGRVPVTRFRRGGPVRMRGHVLSAPRPSPVIGIRLPRRRTVFAAGSAIARPRRTTLPRDHVLRRRTVR